MQHSDFGSPYRNTQQSPVPDRPEFKLGFTITPGAPVLPPPPERQAQTPCPLAAAAGRPRRDAGFFRDRRSRSSSAATGFAPGKTYKLNWNTVVGNRMTGAGWEEQARVDRRRHGGCGRPRGIPLQACRTISAARTTSGSTPTAPRSRAPTGSRRPRLPLDVARGPVGTTFRIHLKGVGWSETANIYTVVYDNATSGYACAFNSQGDVEIIMQATGEPGWHFIDLYPAIYKGKETRPNNYRLPQLTYADDHPGEDLPRFRFAFEVTASNPVGQ